MSCDTKPEQTLVKCFVCKNKLTRAHCGIYLRRGEDDIYNCCDCGIPLCANHVFSVEGDSVNVYCEEHSHYGTESENYLIDTHPDIRQAYWYGNRNRTLWDKIVEFFTCG